MTKLIVTELALKLSRFSSFLQYQINSVIVVSNSIDALQKGFASSEFGILLTRQFAKM